MLVPIDFSDVTPSVVRTAAEWAVAAGYRVHLIHVQPEESELVGYEAGMQLLPPIPLPEPPEDNQFMTNCKTSWPNRESK